METEDNSRKIFVVEVIHTRHSTWQGTVTWTNENKTQEFRSALELLHLIESAVQNPDDPA